MAIPASVVADGAGLAMITTHVHTAHAGGSAIRYPGADLATVAVQCLIRKEALQNTLDAQCEPSSCTSKTGDQVRGATVLRHYPWQPVQVALGTAQIAMAQEPLQLMKGNALF